MNLVDLIDKLFTQFVSREKFIVGKILARLLSIHDACEGLLSEENIQSEKATYIHEKLKSLYKQASKIFKGELNDEELHIVLKAIGSARIYFWLKHIESLPSRDVIDLLSSYKKPKEYIQHNFSPDGLPLYKKGRMPRSLETALILMSSNKDIYPLKFLLPMLKTVCISDIADLNTLIAIKKTA